MAQPVTRTIDTLRRIDAAFPPLRPAGQRPEIRATYLLFLSSPPGEWHPAIPSREPLQAIGRYIRAIAGSKILLSHPASYTTRVSGGGPALKQRCTLSSSRGEALPTNSVLAVSSAIRKRP